MGRVETGIIKVNARSLSLRNPLPCLSWHAGAASRIAAWLGAYFVASSCRMPHHKHGWGLFHIGDSCLLLSTVLTHVQAHQCSAVQ